MKEKEFLWKSFASLTLQNHRDCIALPVEPPPSYSFKHIRVWKDHAAFWSNSSCYEVRNCPWGKPGAIIFSSI